MSSDFQVRSFAETARSTSATLEWANHCRAKYTLRDYAKYRAGCPNGLDIKISESVLEILSIHFSGCSRYSSADESLIERCGFLLVPAVNTAFDSIKSLPVSIMSEVYPVLYHQYFSPDGPAINSAQLAERLAAEGFLAHSGSISDLLGIGERIMASLLFPNRVIDALKACS